LNYQTFQLLPKRQTATMQTISKGKVTKYFCDRGFGFITNENQEEIFFRTQSCINGNIKHGSPVTFILGLNRNHGGKSEAFNITRAYLSKDEQFVVNRPFNHIHQGIGSKLEEIIKLVSCEERSFLIQQIDYPEDVGKSTCVEVSDNDEIVYAKRDGRKGFTKFVMDRQPEATNSISIVLKKTQDFYTIITAYYGKHAEAEPWDERANNNSINFWKNHALLFGSEPIDASSVTTTCPW
jgi:cold shock CspA family protein